MTQKTCITCAFFVDNGATKEYGKCSRVWKEKPQVHLVTGKKTSGEFWFASTMRGHECGPQGNWWESNKPAPKTSDKPKEKRDGWIVRTIKRILMS